MLTLSAQIHCDIQTFNRGISGETSRQGLLRYAGDVQKITPDILTIQFGLNDCNQWLSDNGFPRVSPIAFRANLIEMIERARIFGVEHIILSNNHRTLKEIILPSGNTYEEQRIVYNNIIEEVANLTDVTFCDIEGWFSGIDESEYPKYLLPSPDLLHLSEIGHQHYKDRMIDFIKVKINQVLNKETYFKIAA